KIYYLMQYTSPHSPDAESSRIARGLENGLRAHHVAVEPITWEPATQSFTAGEALANAWLLAPQPITDTLESDWLVISATARNLGWRVAALYHDPHQNTASL